MDGWPARSAVVGTAVVVGPGELHVVNAVVGVAVLEGKRIESRANGLYARAVAAVDDQREPVTGVGIDELARQGGLDSSSMMSGVEASLTIIGGVLTVMKLPNSLVSLVVRSVASAKGAKTRRGPKLTLAV